MHKTTKTTILPFMICLMAGFLFFSSCKDDEGGEPEPGISITAIEPATARVGEEVVITGTGFNADFTQNTVQFTGAAEYVTAAVKEGNETSLTVEVPQGAQSGPVRVTANGESVTSTVEFTLDTSLGDPVLSSLNPTNGFPGTEVVISGENFGEDAAVIEVLFGETATEVSAVTPTSITTSVPEGMAAGEVQVSVSRNGVSATSTLSYTVNEIPVDVKTVYWTAQTGDEGIYKGVITDTGADIILLYDGITYPEAQSPVGIEVDVDNDFVYWSPHNLIVRAPLSGEGPVEVLYDGNELGYTFVDIAIDTDNQNIYAAASNGSDETYILKGTMDGAGELGAIYTFPLVLSFETFLMEGITPETIKLYISGGKLYWTSTVASDIAVMEGSLDGSAEAVVLFDDSDGLEGPTGIAFDPANSKIYIADRPKAASGTNAGSIYSGNLDGTGSLTTVVAPGDNVNLPIDMEIDLENGYIFWMNTVLDENGAAEIMRASLDGTTVEQLFDGFTAPGYFDLEIGEVLPE